MFCYLFAYKKDYILVADFLKFFTLGHLKIVAQLSNKSLSINSHHLGSPLTGFMIKTCPTFIEKGFSLLFFPLC